MASSLASYPISNVRSTGALNIDEVAKFLRLCAIWMGLIFGPVWLVSWLVGEFIPHMIYNVFLQPSIVANQQPPTSPLMWINILQALVPLIAVMVFIPINAMFMVLCERRALALFTVRKGPNRVGPDGMAQTAADAVKLLFKEDITPDGADPVLFTLAPIVFFAPSIFGAIPLLAAVTNNHPLFMQTNLPTGIFFVLAMSAIPVVALVMGGWASNNKYSMVGGLRSAAQAISYELPLVLSIVTLCYLAGTLDVVDIATMQSVRSQEEAQQLTNVQRMRAVDVFPFTQNEQLPEALTAPRSAGLFHWNIFANGVLEFDVKNPQQAIDWAGDHWGRLLAAIGLVVCCFILFGLYMISACAEINRIPFDLPEAESELVSGFNTEYSGIKFAIFFLAEFTNLFIVATIATVLFLGGGSSPIPGFLDPEFFQKYIFIPIGNALGKPADTDELRWLIGSLFNPVTLSAWLWVILKVYTIVFFAILVRGTLPRFRIDQLMAFCWKRLIPLSLIVFLACAYLREIVTRG